MRLYVYVSDDEYELPIAVGDTMRELAKLLGVSEASVRQAYYRKRKNKVQKSQYIIVEVEDD